MNNPTLPVSVVVMTFNEEVNVEKCLQSLVGWADDVFVVDSYSTDATEEICKRYTEKFYQNRYVSHPVQWDWALNNLPFAHEWVFAVDADFIVTDELKKALSQEMTTLTANIHGIYVRHRQVFRGRFLKHGTIYPRYWLRLFRRNSVFIDNSDLVDLHFYVNGETIKVECDVIEDNVKERNLEFWVSKQVRFAQRAAVEEIKRRETLQLSPVTPKLFGTPDQRTLWLKTKWYFFPLYWRAIFYFLYRYIFRLGFLDGKEGFLYHFTQALVYRVMVDARIEELKREKVSGADLDVKAVALGPKVNS
ncbi:MAG: glycosyltransferase family 2 protein [Blastocatellia bacterium]